MTVSRQLVALAAIAALASFGAALAQAQERTDGSDYHPLLMNSPSSAEVQAGAVSAAHPTTTEVIGQSTGMPAMNSTMSSVDAQAAAIAAAHATGSEMPGQTTSPMPLSGNTH